VVDEYDLLLMRMIDEQYTQTPFYRFQEDGGSPETQRLSGQQEACAKTDAGDEPGGYLSETSSEQAR